MACNGSLSSALPLDLDKLQSITGGRSTLQDDLFEIFFFNVAECIGAMENYCTEEKSEKWNSATTELRDISISLGALELAKACEMAQKDSVVSIEEKKKLIAMIRTHIQRLRAFIRNTRY